MRCWLLACGNSRRWILDKFSNGLLINCVPDSISHAGAITQLLGMERMAYFSGGKKDRVSFNMTIKRWL
jgi:hypothetical protein